MIELINVGMVTHVCQHMLIVRFLLRTMLTIGLIFANTSSEALATCSGETHVLETLINVF